MSEARTWNGTDLLLKGRKKEMLCVSICIEAYLTTTRTTTTTT